MNSNLDYLSKEEINSFVYMSDDDWTDCRTVVIDGREYTKWGKLQVVTFVGLMYSTKNKDTGKTENYVVVGMSKQHPEDIVNNRKIAVETARINALTDPVMVFYNVSKKFNNHLFKTMMDTYFESLDLDFVLTNDELKKKQCEKFKNDWNFYLGSNG